MGPYWSFIDNSAAQWALTKGYSRNDEANVLVTLFDAATVLKAACPWFDRVSSAANISDEVASMDFRRARKDNLTECYLDYNGVWVLLRQALEMRFDKLPEVASKLCVVAKRVQLLS